MANFNVIRKSEGTNYWLLEVGGVFHACVLVPGELGAGDYGQYMSCGTFSHAEDFETVADDLAEEIRYMMTQSIRMRS